MIYEYSCQKHGSFDVVKGVDAIERPEPCPACEGDTQRMFKPSVSLGFGTFKPGYYHAFGKGFRSASELKDELRRQRYEHGRDLQEVGNDRIKTKKVKHEIDKAEVAAAYKSELIKAKRGE